MENGEMGGENGNPEESGPAEPTGEGLGNIPEAGELGNELGEMQEGQEIDSMSELSDTYDQGLDLNRQVSDLKKQVEEDRAAIDDLRNFLGSESRDIPADATLKELADKQDELSESMDALEVKVLDAPEDGEVEGTKQEIEGVHSMQAENRDFAREMKEMRQEFVEKFIKDSIDYANRHWAAQFQQAENGNKARDLVAKKLAFEITKETQEFVEKGGNFEIGWYGRLECAKFRTPDGQSKMFITGFNLKASGLMGGASTDETTEENDEDEENSGKGNDSKELPLAA